MKLSVKGQALPFELESLLVSEVLVRAQTVTGACALGPVGFSSCGSLAVEHRLSSCI